MQRSCLVKDLGLIDYHEAYAIQKRTVLDVASGSADTLLFCTHPTVITLGRLTQPGHILISQNELRQHHIQVINIDRGGDITLHGPGQLVIYPILNLHHHGRDLRIHLAKLEQVVIDLLKDFGILANRFEDKTGVWVKERKLASIGVGVKKWVSFHGIGLNVNIDLKLFSMIKPCGLDVRMTSMAEIKGRGIDLDTVQESALKYFTQNFNLEIAEQNEKCIAS